jgi:hypothetical protein
MTKNLPDNVTGTTEEVGKQRYLYIIRFTKVVEKRDEMSKEYGWVFCGRSEMKNLWGGLLINNNRDLEGEERG